MMEEKCQHLKHNTFFHPFAQQGKLSYSILHKIFLDLFSFFPVSGHAKAHDFEGDRESFSE